MKSRPGLHRKLLRTSPTRHSLINDVPALVSKPRQHRKRLIKAHSKEPKAFRRSISRNCRLARQRERIRVPAFHVLQTICSTESDSHAEGDAVAAFADKKIRVLTRLAD